jgi:glycosyltransferase involved in cell wall biosynthesis
MPSLSVVLPAYNTGFEILATVEEVSEKLNPYLDFNRGIVVVDDGSDISTDTVEYAREAGAFVVCQPYNMGKGAAVREGFRATTSDVVAFLDADGAYDPDLLLEFMEEIRYYDVVIGVRKPGASGGRVSLVRNLASRFFRALTSVTLIEPRSDTQAGIKLVRREVANAFCHAGIIDRFSFDVELLALCETRGWRIGEVEVAPREQPSSTVKFSSEAIRTCLSLLRIRRRQARGAYRA